MNQDHIAAVVRGRVVPLATKTAFTGAALGVSLFAGAMATGEAQARLGTKPALMLMGALATAGLLAFFARARHQVLFVWPVLTGALFPFVQEPKGNPVVTFDRVWVGSMIATIAGVATSAHRSRARVAFTRAFLALIVVWGAQAALTPATTRNLALGTWIDALFVPYLLFTATRLFSRSELRRHQIAAAIMLGGVVLAAIGIAESIFGFELASRSGGSLRVESELATVRITGPYPVPEPYALALLMTFAATLYWTQLRAPNRYFVGFAAASVQLVAIGLTLFRAAWIGAAIIAFVAIGVRRGRWPRALYVGAIMGAILISAVSQVKHNSGLGERVNNTDNIYGRFATYEQGIHMFTSHPLLGVGLDRYHDVAQGLPPRVVHGVESVTFPHSSFILVLAEQGLIGFIPLLVLSIATWRLLRALRHARAPDAIVLGPAVIGASLAYLVMSLTLTMITYGPSNAFFAMVLGLGAGTLDGDSAAAPSAVEA